MYVLGEGVFGYASGKGFMCMRIRASNFRPLNSWEIEIAKKTIYSRLSARKVIISHMAS